MRVLSPGFSYRYESIYENTTHDGVQSKSCAVLHYSRSRDARTLAICPISSIACPLLPYAGIHGFGSQKQSSLVRLREKQALTRSSATPFLSHTPESSFIMESRFHCEGFLSIPFPGKPFKPGRQDSGIMQSFKCVNIVSHFMCLVKQKGHCPRSVTIRYLILFSLPFSSLLF